jgi:hypothetical protein
VAIPDEDKGEDDEDAPLKKDKLPVGVAQVLTAVKAAGRPLTQAEVAKIVDKGQPQVSRDLAKLVTMGLIVLEGKGVEGDPKRYRSLLEGEVVNHAPPAAPPAQRTAGRAPAVGAAAARRRPRRPVV